jgi:rhodanese-related sulfurtransferase
MSCLRIACSVLLLSALALSGVQAAQVPRMDKDELKSILNTPNLILLDVRPTGQWAVSSRKIPGATHKDPYRARHWGKKLDKNKTVVTYCA